MKICKKGAFKAGYGAASQGKGQAKGFIKRFKAGIGTEGNDKGQTKGSIKNAPKPIRGRRQRQRPSQEVYKHALRPGSGPTAKA